jgi:hypothetical protein
MPLTVRECPAELHARLERAAAASGRSKSREVLAWLESHAQQRPAERMSESVLRARIQARRGTVRLSAREIRQAQTEGRA